MALAEIGLLENRNVIHDTSRAIAASLPRLPLLLDTALRRVPSRFERYVAGRLARSAPHSWLNRLPLYAALHLSFVAGAVALYGPRVVLEELNDDDAWRCEAAGFDIVHKGALGIRPFLDDLQAPLQAKRKEQGPKAMYGRLYDWLAHECNDRAYDPVRDIILEHALETLPFGPGDSLFGRKIIVRKVHSVQTASKEFGLHPKRMRKMLRRARLTGPNTERLADNKVTFDAAAAGSFLKRLSQSMSMEGLRHYLNVPSQHVRGLLKRGFIGPMIVGGRGKGSYAFLRSDVDALLQRLLRNADPTLHSDPAMVPMIAAAKHSCSPVMDVVALVLDGKLERVGRDPDEHGFLSVLVDAEEVRPLVTPPKRKGLSLEDTKNLLHHTSRAVKALVEQGLIQVAIIKNPVTKWPQPIVDPKELARFKREFVSLQVLAQERGEDFRLVKKALVAAGVRPVADPEKLLLTLYRRSDLP